MGGDERGCACMDMGRAVLGIPCWGYVCALAGGVVSVVTGGWALLRRCLD